MVRLLYFWKSGRRYFKAIFPPDKSSAALLSTLAIFAAGFIVRPFGALVFGRLGDLIGRKYTFLLTLVLMGTSTFLIGLIPNYASIGIAAPIFILVLRLIQGLALGWRIRRSGYLCGRARARRSPWFFYQLDSNYRHPWFVYRWALFFLPEMRWALKLLPVGVGEFHLLFRPYWLSFLLL